MIRAFVIAMAIVALGSEFSERVRIKQEEAILRKLPEAEAVAYYEILKKRVQKVRIMRGLVLVAMVVLVFAVKKIIMSPTAVTP